MGCCTEKEAVLVKQAFQRKDKISINIKRSRRKSTSDTLKLEPIYREMDTARYRCCEQSHDHFNDVVIKPEYSTINKTFQLIDKPLNKTKGFSEVWKAIHI